ncbi:MAG TPA: hypothetical protein DGT23_32470 [Micromonosporaceae bacterium]|nr:hypothetical protein [Micromonosporaceae bacterium]
MTSPRRRSWSRGGDDTLEWDRKATTTPRSTRESWRRALLSLATPAVERAALGPARQPVVASTSDPLATWWELVTRPLWGLAAAGKIAVIREFPGRHAGDTPEKLPDHADLLWPQLRHSISAGVDPGNPWYIGPPRDRHQCLVESAALGFALMLAPQQLWDPLSGKQRDQLGGWLRAAAEAEPVDNNWHFFPVLAGRGLDAVGFERDRSTDAAHLARLDSFLLGDGWYQDGFTNRTDYYNPFGFHFYNLLLGRTDNVSAFAEQFQHWFAVDGSAVPFGRSLGYRFAQGAFWGALAYADAEVLPWQRIRGLAERHLDWWWQQPILDGEGLLSVGYRYPNSGVVEQYIGGGSPYWATKFFLPLALPEDHPFWTAAPSSLEDGISSQPHARAVLSRHDGDVVLLNGQGWAEWARGGEAKYAKFAYATRAGFSVPVGNRSLEFGSYDSMLALSDDGGRTWRAREEVLESCVDGDVVWTKWCPWPDVTIETWLKPMGGWHLRAHRVVTARPLMTAEGGFCLPWTTRDLPQLGPTILDLDGDRTFELVQPIAGTNVLHPRTVLPTLRGTSPPGEHWLTCAVSALAAL